MEHISGKTVGRLSQYRRILLTLQASGHSHVHSQTIASYTGMTAAQVRRDLMTIDVVGTPAKGYRTSQVVEQLNHFFQTAQQQHLAIAGMGNVGRALLAYLSQHRPETPIVAAFDNDPDKVHKEFQGCTCYPVEWMGELVQKLSIAVGIIAVPAVAAQDVAERFVQGGVTGILNFAPVPLQLPQEVFVEYIDINMELDKVAYFAGTGKSSLT